MQTNLAVEQSRIIRWSVSPWNQSGRKGKGLWTKTRLGGRLFAVVSVRLWNVCFVASVEDTFYWSRGT